jgi:hypothetical protein
MDIQKCDRDSTPVGRWGRSGVVEPLARVVEPLARVVEPLARLGL